MMKRKNKKKAAQQSKKHVQLQARLNFTRDPWRNSKNLSMVAEYDSATREITHSAPRLTARLTLVSLSVDDSPFLFTPVTPFVGALCLPLHAHQQIRESERRCSEQSDRAHRAFYGHCRKGRPHCSRHLWRRKHKEIHHRDYGNWRGHFRL